MSKTIIYGLLAASLDAAVCFNATAVAGYFTVSEWYLAVVLVIIAVALHLAFFKSLRTALRMRAIIRAPQHSSKRRAELQNRHSQRKARPRAYINPWHNV